MMELQRILGGTLPRARAAILITVVGIGCLVTGCGQKGPLYLKPAVAATPPAPPAPVTGTASAPASATSTR